MTHQPHNPIQRVLFVCLGNICRSPMAEAVMRDAVKSRNLQDRIEVASCGTGQWHLGHPPHPGTRQILDEAGISYEGQRAKNMDADQIISYDYIIAMDKSNVADLVAMGVPKEKIRLFTDYIPDREGTDVPDPYYHDNFDYVFELVQAGVQGLLRHITKAAGEQRS